MRRPLDNRAYPALYLGGTHSQETGTSPPSCLLLKNRLCMCPIKVNSNAIEHIVHPSC